MDLHIEAATLDEFEAVMNDVAIDLVLANHVTLPDFADTPMRDLIPAIIWQKPELAALPA